MTCAVSLPAAYTNPFNEGGADIQNDGCESLDFNWINAKHSRSGLSDFRRCSTPCHVEANTGSPISYRMEISAGLSDSDKPANINFRETDLKEIGTQNHVPANGRQAAANLSEKNNLTVVKIDQTQIERIESFGVKRKAEEVASEEDYIPPKRVSPFLNTPKERKEERKKILKVSIKKLKQLNDPEAFLRRTVLVNNVTKRLQSEIRQEKLKTKKYAANGRKSVSAFGVDINNCMSDMYMIDDPFLSGVHEKITDDMTETFINNVFREMDDKSDESVADEKTGFKGNFVEQNCRDSRPITGLNSTSSNESVINPRVVNIYAAESIEECLDNRAFMQEIPVEGCDRIKLSSGVESGKNICYDNYHDNETMNLNEMDVNSDQDTRPCKTNPENIVMLEQSAYLSFHCTNPAQHKSISNKDKTKTYFTRTSAITDLYGCSEQIDLNQNVDQKSLSHSLNMLLSYTEL